ncbi:putative Pentatricopeptide repeat domain containing protein [Klebsormidium nitens]|uniref:Putative Pentatricopeptide repeat domain containing protein n=1 Tax=Klebsormidium nitens TaxID=105231 RepID=A0A1Y1HQP9_KLENI|nr:putative Pentatricopeptide repeat domain containing protein [Klebsormidium nitens]|eukprot:GAQ78887.1 putative Pentatricopeptide repeat domain containing protein [Klebsormidium nitens]
MTAWPLHLLEHLKPSASGARRIGSQYPNPHAVSSEARFAGPTEASSADAPDLLTILQTRLQAAALERSVVIADRRPVDLEAPGNQSLSPGHIGATVESALSSAKGADRDVASPSNGMLTPQDDASDSGLVDGLRPSSEDFAGEGKVAVRIDQKKGASKEISHTIRKRQARWINPDKLSSQQIEEGKLAPAKGKNVQRSRRSPGSEAADDGLVVRSLGKQSKSFSLARGSPVDGNLQSDDHLGSGVPSGREHDGTASRDTKLPTGNEERRMGQVEFSSDLAATPVGPSDCTAKRQLDRRRQSHWSASTSSPTSDPAKPLPASLVSTFTLLNNEGSESLPGLIASLGQRDDLDERSWGLLVGQLAAAGNLEAALECHESLVQRGGCISTADALDFIKAIEYRRNTKSLLTALKQFRAARRLTTPIFNAFLVAFNKCGEPRRAVVMFHKLGAAVKVDHSSYHEVLKACQELRLWETAMHLLREMEATETWPDVADYTMGITACARARQWTKALDLLEVMDRVGCPCNTAAINSAINACARVGEWQHALRLLLRMRDLGLAPNVVTWSSLLTACGQGPASSGVVKEVVNSMLSSGCNPNDVTWTAAIDALGRTGDWRAAEACFAKQLDRRRVPRAPSWCALIKAYGGAGEWTRALAAFESMRKAGIAPDTPHWTAVIRAVGSGKAWARTQFGTVKNMHGLVRALYAQMKEAGCPPNEVTYTSLIQIYGRCLHWRAAQAVFHEALHAADRGECAVSVVMFNALAVAYAESGCFRRLWDLVMTDMVHEYGVKPDRFTYTILIKACVKNNKGRILSGQVYRKMQESGVKPDSRTYDWLAQGYEQTGLPDRAWKVLESMGP